MHILIKTKDLLGLENNNDCYNLMSKDYKTKNKLNIYEKDNIDFKILATIDNYNPSVRPYFKNDISERVLVSKITKSIESLNIDLKKFLI